MPQDDVQAKIAKAKAAGYSDAEIQAYLGKAGPQAISGSSAPAQPSSASSLWHWLTTPGQSSEYPITSKVPVTGGPPAPGSWEEKGIQAAQPMRDSTSAINPFGPTEIPGQSPLRKTGNALENFGAAMAALYPVQTVKSMIGGGLGSLAGSYGGGKLAGYLAGPEYENIGKGLGGLAGGLYGGYKGWTGGSPVLGFPGSRAQLFQRLGRAVEAFGKEEPAAASGAAREAAGGTAATTGPAGESSQTALGSQAGPSGPKNAGELSATVQRIRGGQGPGTAAASPTIYTPESLASEQGMSTAALGKGGFNLTIPPEQQEIMRRVQSAAPGTFTPKPSQGFESLGRTSPYQGAPPMNPPSGTSPSFGEPEGPLDAAIRGAAGQNPVIKSTDRAMAGEMPSKIKFMNLIRKKAQEGR